MDTQTHNFDTPAKGKTTQEPQSTNAKWGDSQIKEASQDQENYEDRIADIQNKIKETKEKLQSNSIARSKHTDKLSEQYLDLENERRIYKLDLINFNYAHLRCFTLHAIEEKQKKQAEQNELEQQRKIQEQERKIRQQRQTLEKKQIEQEMRAKIKAQEDEINEKYKQLAADRRAYIERLRNDGPSEIKEKSKIEEEGQQRQGQQESLLAAQRKARIARIEAELAVSRSLRRSRQALLQAELSTLNAYRHYPYSYTYDYYLSYPYWRRYSLYDSAYDYPSYYPYYSRWWYY